MSRLVNVSNRVALPGARADGGLAIGLLAAMHAAGGLWFGWNGRTYPDGAEPPDAEDLQRGNVSFRTIGLAETMFGQYYNGFSNGTLWPLFHYFLDSFHYQEEQYEAYRAVNALFAQELLPLLRPDDLVWVHDYHLIPLAAQLRARQVSAPIGFFLHIRFPHFEVLRALPVHRDIMSALLAYDVVGFQTEVDRQAFMDAARALFGRNCVVSADVIVHAGRRVRAGVFPIGVDADAIRRSVERNKASPAVLNMSQGLQDRRLIIGVDRLDYSKGLLERFDAYQRFLEDFPQHQGAVTYLQIAPLGRQNVRAYARIRAALEQSAGRTNGRFANVDWTPIRYLNRNFPHPTLLGFLRLAQVCLVTPLRDGMNLVAKEFIAAQDPANPGMLVLSDRAGAASELTDALLVNPYDIRSIARALKQALDMPLTERRARHEKLYQTLQEHNVHTWWRSFLAALQQARQESRSSRPSEARGSAADRHSNTRP